MRVHRLVQSITMTGLPLVLTICFALASASAQEKIQSIAVTAKDQAAAASATHSALHGMGLANVNRKLLWAAGNPVKSLAALSSFSGNSPQGFFPGDISDPDQGAVVQSAQSHGLYVNCQPSCWGTPSTFLNNFDKSDMIHVSDQYVGSFANNRYSIGTGGLLTGSLPPILFDSDIIAIAHTGAAAFGSGYHHIYHIFLPPGQDVCFTGTSECYSPDNPDTFAFCAYHASVDFSDIGHVLLTVEPYQNVDGCSVVQPSPNGPVVDSTADVLSHELFETITDPDGDAWWNHYDLDLFGAEIADECQNFNFGYPNVTLNGKKYEIQPEYSNFRHACVFSPFIWPF
jgi:hypothetical protein